MCIMLFVQFPNKNLSALLLSILASIPVLNLDLAIYTTRSPAMKHICYFPCFMIHCIFGVNMFLHVQIVVKLSETYFLFTK